MLIGFTIHCGCGGHAGMVTPTSGDAVINGMSIRNSMPAIRQHLGVCPQFDILWPDITVEEHLQLYAAIKGFARADVPIVVDAAIRNVGMAPTAVIRPCVCVERLTRAFLRLVVTYLSCASCVEASSAKRQSEAIESPGDGGFVRSNQISTHMPMGPTGYIFAFFFDHWIRSVKAASEVLAVRSGTSLMSHVFGQLVG